MTTKLVLTNGQRVLATLTVRELASDDDIQRFDVTSQQINKALDQADVTAPDIRAFLRSLLEELEGQE